MLKDGMTDMLITVKEHKIVDGAFMDSNCNRNSISNNFDCQSN